MGSTMDPGDEIIILNHLQITMVFHCIWVNVVPVISSIDTGFALPAIADFENLLRQNNLICNPGNPTVICILKGNDAACWISKKRHDLLMMKFTENLLMTEIFIILNIPD
jgi:aspartate aminotransferase